MTMTCENKGLIARCRVQRLLNDPDNAVEESLRGVAMINSGLVVLKGCKAILRRDYDNMHGKVKLVSGGGGGNEPAHSGFVGPGMLTAAVFGDVYTAPTIDSIVKVIEELGTNHPPGILLIVQNFFGHYLNFSLAKSRVESKGFPIQMVIVQDDVSNVDVNQSAKRGLLGTLFIHKIAGAMAEEKTSLDEIYNTCNKIIESDISSIGICTNISLPCMSGRKTGEMQIGYGIHGESGITYIDSKTSQESVSILLKNLLKKDCESKLKGNFQIGHEIAVMISNLGGCSQLETNIFVMELLQQLNSCGLIVKRVYSGHLMSALDNSGFQISLLNLSSNKSLIRYLDSPTLAPAWPRSLSAKNVGFDAEKDLATVMESGKHVKDTKDEYLSNIPNMGPVLEDRTGQVFLTILTFACDAVIACSDQLDIMDEESGDGDCGRTLSRGAKAIKAAIKDNRLFPFRPFVILTQISRVIEQTMGGLQGALYSLFFAAAAQVFEKSSKNDKIDAFLWLKAFIAANNIIAEICGTKEGDRTMLDPLLAAQNRLVELLYANYHPIQAFGQAVSAAEQRAIETTFMPATVGRASMLKNRKFQYPDPGAHAVGIWMRATYEGVKLKFVCHCEVID